MEMRKKIKKRLLIMLSLSVGLFISASMISVAVKKYFAPEEVVKRLNSEIALSLNDLDSEIEKIASQNFDENPPIIKFLSENYKNTFSKKGIEILVYENDSLKYWTDNVFTAPYIKDSENFTSDVVSSGNGFYLVKSRKVRNSIIVGLQLIRYKYRYSNDYLPTGFYKRFSAPDNTGINLRPGEYNIKSAQGKFLFSVSFEQPLELQIWLQYLIFSLYISSFLLLIAAIFTAYILLMHNFGRKWLTMLFFTIDVILLRAFQLYFHFPGDLYQLVFFNPTYFASSDILPSMGDFLINTLIGLQLSVIILKYLGKYSFRPQLQETARKIFPVFFILLIILLYNFLVDTISGLVLNSGISYRFENFLSLPHLSHIGILIISTLLLSFLFLLELISRLYIRCSSKQIVFWLSALSGVILYAVFTIINDDFDYILLIFLVLLTVVLYYHLHIKPSLRLRLSKIISFVILFSAFATYLINKTETTREHEKRILLATHLSDARDNLAEYYFYEASKSIKQDIKLSEMMSADVPDSLQSGISEYIRTTYFSGYWDKYLIQITVCKPDKKLNIKPGNIVSGCEEYFDGKINDFMRPVSVPGLYFLRQSVDAMYYLGKIGFTSDTSELKARNFIYVEISSNDIWKGLGYPELLIDSKNANVDNLYGYSYAFYNKGELVKNVGKFSYDIENELLADEKSKDGFVNINGYDHLIYQTDPNTMIIMSKESPHFADLIAPFSYIFILLIIILFIVNWVYGSTLEWNIGIHTFRLRLQVIMISVIVVSSMILVTVSLLFINNLNRNKNNEILSEKLNSVLIDLETRYGTVPSFDQVPGEELSDLLLNLSNTYFTDINIYDRKGLLLASSRDQIFREGMISEQINTASARQLMVDKKSFFIQRENIGSYSFLSAYTPIRNIDNQLLGYLNLPYFARQEEIRREISGLISAFANIYLIMIVVTVLLALLLSGHITKPLQRIGYQFSMVKMGEKNAKIDWARKDEIGRLVDEYNRMIDEMEKSAELLARSERESAWRQMARQVAHEIKNPLTPIKLSMQLLMRAWDDKAPDWEARLKRFSQTLIMQIDTLSSIATEFSDFAQMPESQIQHFDVIPLVQQSAALFRDQSDCEILVIADFQECVISADPNQMLRVFNNLIKNALQAIPMDRQGLLKITLNKVNDLCEISFKDNGTGIPVEKQQLIFMPNFTTKTAGMGLGLAMVKNIVNNTSGTIWFETVPGEGTTFVVSLPLKDKGANI